MRAAFLAAFFLAVVTPSAWAGSVVVAEPFFDTETGGSGQNGRQAAVAAGQPMVGLGDDDQSLYGIRCWQKGQLILEDVNWSTPQLSAQFIALRKVGSPSPGLYLVDFQETFCELKQLAPQTEPALPGEK